MILDTSVDGALGSHLRPTTILIRKDGVVPLHRHEQAACHGHTNGLNSSKLCLSFFFFFNSLLTKIGLVINQTVPKSLSNKALSTEQCPGFLDKCSISSGFNTTSVCLHICVLMLNSLAGCCIA